MIEENLVLEGSLKCLIVQREERRGRQNRVFGPVQKSRFLIHSRSIENIRPFEEIQQNEKRSQGGFHDKIRGEKAVLWQPISAG